MLNKLFPETNYDKIQYDKEGLYSITNYKEADIISSIIKNNFEVNKNIRIFDGTGGLGGNTFSFSKNFKSVTTVEINKERCNMLMNNVGLYKLSNVNIINSDSVEFILLNKDKYDVYFFDPPWGGPDYKKQKNIRFKMGQYNLDNLVEKFDVNANKLILFKLPFNYDFSEFNSFNYKLYQVNKYYIIVILL
jgi:hypothetical protein